MKTIYLLLCAVLLIGTVKPVAAQENDKGKMGDMFVHPFLTHMALPDPPGEMSLRLTPFQQRMDSIVSQDMAIHIEAGLLPGLGIHIRSDGIKTAPYSEVMLMYSFLHDATYNNGLSVFGQVSLRGYRRKYAHQSGRQNG